MKAAFCFLIFLSYVASNNIEECTRDYPNRGGSPQEIKAPWLAAIGISRPYEDFTMLCSGSILTKKLIVTAAHCFFAPKTPTDVRAGDNDVDSRYAKERKILDKKIHPDYDRGSKIKTYYFDIAIITVDEDFEYSSRISPICLPVRSSLHPGDGIGISVQGWGAKGKEVSENSVTIQSKGSLPFKS